jgi:hypothetical protein
MIPPQMILYPHKLIIQISAYKFKEKTVESLLL